MSTASRLSTTPCKMTLNTGTVAVEANPNALSFDFDYV